LTIPSFVRKDNKKLNSVIFGRKLVEIDKGLIYLRSRRIRREYFSCEVAALNKKTFILFLEGPDIKAHLNRLKFSPCKIVNYFPNTPNAATIQPKYKKVF
jgi:hypothetical protein